MFPPANTYNVRVIKGARTTKSEYTINVTDKDFLNGNNNPLDISTYYLIDSNSKIDVYYNSVTGKKMGKSFSYSGQSSPSYKYVDFSVSDARFNGNEDIFIKITGDSPLLNFVSVSRQMNVFNLPLEWSADTVFLADAITESNYNEAITVDTDIIEPEKDALSFIKISGPTWQNINSSGMLNGAPDNGSEGINSFVVQASDGNGNKVNATLVLNVKNVTSSPLIDKSNVSVYPIPAKDKLIITGINGTINYQIFNMTGYKILEGKTENNMIITDVLVTGTYILKLEDEIISIVKI